MSTPKKPYKLKTLDEVFNEMSESEQKRVLKRFRQLVAADYRARGEEVPPEYR